MARRFFHLSRFIVLIPVAISFICASFLMAYQGIALLNSIYVLIEDPQMSQNAVKVFAVGMIEGVDVFLIAIGLYIISLGLYSLFIDNDFVFNGWLKLNDLEELKGNLLSIVIAVLAVLFLKEAVSWTSGSDILSFGAANGIVIAALAYFLRK